MAIGVRRPKGVVLPAQVLAALPQAPEPRLVRVVQLAHGRQAVLREAVARSWLAHRYFWLSPKTPPAKAACSTESTRATT